MMQNSILVGVVVMAVVLLGTTASAVQGDDPGVSSQADVQLQERSRAQPQTEPSPESTAGIARPEPKQGDETAGVEEVEGIGPDLNTNLK
jgi:predicted flap endonuclease-1-like 5' DNA nuclease